MQDQDWQHGMDAATALARAITGDEAAFVVLYRSLQPRILRYAASLVGADAEDVASETWLQVARDVRGFIGDIEGFRGWVARIARNRAMDHLRSRARRPVVLDDLVGLLELPGRDDTAAEALDRLHTAQAVALVATLPREQAEAVMLRAVIGLDAATAASVLGKRPTAVRVAAHRGLKRLAAQLSSGDAARPPAKGPRAASGAAPQTAQQAAPKGSGADQAGNAAASRDA